LDSAAQVRLGVLTKPERGDLLRQALRAAVKSGPVPLDDEMTAAEAFQAIVQVCIKQFRLNEDLLLTSRSTEALHQTRVALRQLRSAFSVFKPLLGAEAVRELCDGLRDLAGRLGPARELDVLLQRARPGLLRDRLQTEREAAYDRVEEELGSDKARALMLTLVEWVHSGSLLVNPDTEETRTLPVRTFAGRALSRFRRKVKEGGRNLRGADDAARHELRKDAKKLRYAAEFFALLFDGKSEKAQQQDFIAALEAVQDKLGELNDLATMPHVLDRLGIADDPEAPALLAGSKKKALIAAAADAHGNLIDAGRYWR
jgi:CHAD domain-containing protein